MTNRHGTLHQFTAFKLPAHGTGLADQLLADAMIFNKTSCALSNFPGEHRPNGDYVRTIRRDLASAWQSFSVAANERLLAKARRVASA